MLDIIHVATTKWYETGQVATAKTHCEAGAKLSTCQFVVCARLTFSLAAWAGELLGTALSDQAW